MKLYECTYMIVLSLKNGDSSLQIINYKKIVDVNKFKIEVFRKNRQHLKYGRNSSLCDRLALMEMLVEEFVFPR